MVSAKVDRTASAAGGRLEDLYLRYADGAARLAYLLVEDRALAEDIAQDAFVRLAGRLAHLRDPAAFEAYLRRTIVNLSRSHLRRKRVERAYLRREQGSISSASGGAEAGRAVEDRDALWRAMRRLSDRQRAAIVLRYFEDLSEAEVAGVLRCRPGTVKSLVARGLEAMRAEMRGERA
jgi:RNA polymerase sigma-70 factor (sigma-E family)